VRKRLWWPVLAACLVLLLASCSTSSNGSAAKTTTTLRPVNVLAAMARAPDLTTFLTARLAVAATTLKGAGPVTVFAPTNKAFATLPKNTLIASGAAGRQRLQQLVLGHIVKGIVTADSRAPRRVTTLSGTTLTLSKVGDTIVVTDPRGRRARVISTIPGTNGVVYVIDGVLLPT